MSARLGMKYLLRGALFTVAIVATLYFLPLLSRPIVGFYVARANAASINDVESDVDTVISNSIQARTEAADLRKQDHEEKLTDEKLRRQASHEIHTAKIEQAKAKRLIAIYDRQIEQSLRKQHIYDREIAISRKRIAIANTAVSSARTKLKIANDELQIAKNEKRALERELAQKRNELVNLRNATSQDNARTSAIAREINRYKRRPKANIQR